MAQIPAGVNVTRPSFAKVAAAGLKLSGPQQAPGQTEHIHKQPIVSLPPEVPTSLSPPDPPNQLPFTPKQRSADAVAPRVSKDAAPQDMSGPAVHVHAADAAVPHDGPLRISEGMLAAATNEEAATQVSSSIDSMKAASVDGRSVASGTTFTLDEKESLRPDDSASVMAGEDEDTSPNGAGLPGAHAGSDDERQAFCDQLREISAMDTVGQADHAPGFVRDGDMLQGILYVPPRGPGVGNVPASPRVGPDAGRDSDSPPDPKLLEALESPKDRIMVLKLEQDIVDFVKDPKESSLKLPQTNAFYRMLAHKLADYYMLGHIVDESTMAVRIFKTPNCRIPPSLTGIATPSTAASTPPPIGPQMKILRRGVGGAGPTIANGSSFTPKSTSENGESGNEEDRKSKLPATREEREARYEAARKRIMGSEPPSISPEEAQEKNTSRSSSAAGRKGTRKKQRADSDDDFEARSAYSAYYPAGMGPTAPVAGTYSLPPGAHQQTSQMSPPPFAGQASSNGYQQYSSQANSGWSSSSYYAPNPPQNWTQPPQASYDLAGDFQRTMSFQSRGMAMPNPGAQQTYNPPYNQQMPTPPQPWSPQSTYLANPVQSSSNYPQGYATQTPQAQNSFQDGQPYAYGQLPSQTFPGRPPSKLEHPLPGSYKGKHFNPQSQTFIPSQVNGTNAMPFQPVTPSMYQYNLGFGLSSPHRQDPGSLQSPNFASSQSNASTAATPPRTQGQPMMHPLPQPVFPRQPSPNVPLPAKPVTTPPRPPDKGNAISGIPAIVSSTPSQSSKNGGGSSSSSIAKWGTPASLPAKPPPPSNPPFDPAKFAQTQRQSPSASATSHSLNSMPTFGFMPPVTDGYAVHGQTRRM